MFRVKMNPGTMGDLFPGMEMYKRAEIPKLEFKRKKTTYKLPDLRLLHPLGIQAIDCCLKQMITTPEYTNIAINAEQLDKEQREVVCEIVMSCDFSAKRRSHEVGGCIAFESTVSCTENGIVVLYFQANDHLARALHAVAKVDNSFYELLMDACDYMLDNPPVAS